MSEPTYDVDYFIAKFEAIPDGNWTTGTFQTASGQCCALGHCGARTIDRKDKYTDEANSLAFIFARSIGIHAADVNDGKYCEFLQPTPRARIIAALNEIKAKGEK